MYTVYVLIKLFFSLGVDLYTDEYAFDFFSFFFFFI